MSSDLNEKVSRSQLILKSLSAEELQLLRFLVAGYSQSTIARRLKLTHEEAVAMKQSLRRKLGAKTTADAVRFGIYAGL